MHFDVLLIVLDMPLIHGSLLNEPTLVKMHLQGNSSKDIKNRFAVKLKEEN